MPRVGYLLVVTAAPGGIALGRDEDAQEKQRPYTSGPGHGYQEHETHSPEGAALREVLLG